MNAMRSMQICLSCRWYLTFVYPVFMPNRYAMPPSFPLSKFFSTILLKRSSSTISQRNSSSLSLAFHPYGSKCQNSCNASNLYFFYPSTTSHERHTLLSSLSWEANVNPVSFSDDSSSSESNSRSTRIPFPSQGQSNKSCVSQLISRYENKFFNSSTVKLFPLDPLPSYTSAHHLAWIPWTNLQELV